jgi:hypothetical protein
MKSTISLIFSLFFLAPLSAQVLSVDRENGQDSVQKKVAFTWTSGVALDKQKTNILEIESAEELDLFFKNNQVLILLGNTALQTNGTSILENNGYFMLRLRDNDKKRVSPDYYAQLQWNGILGMQNRTLAGVNARFKFWENKESDLYIASGAFFEHELWNPALSSFDFDSSVISVTRNLIRWNNAAKMALKITDNIDFATSNFIQFPLNDSFSHFLDPRWAMNASIFFKINKHLSINCNYEHNLDFYRALPVDTYYYSLNFRLQLSW